MSDSKSDLWTLLRKRFPSGEYALLPEVRNAAGHSASRSADGIAFNLWPSRGLAIEGIEIKSYRSDWLSELKKPEKAEAIYKYCDFWWLVTDKEGIAKIEEIPATWGWMCVVKGRLVTMKSAPALSPVKIEKGIVASMLKRATQGMIPESTIADKVKEAYERGRDTRNVGEKDFKSDLERVKKSVWEFEAASGIRINEWTGGRIGEAVKLYIDRKEERFIKDVNNLKDTAKALIEYLEKVSTTPEEVNTRLNNQ